MRDTRRRGFAENVRLIPDILLPSQLGRDLPQPERALAASVLQDAIECFLQHHGATCPRRRRLFEDAAVWLFAVEDEAPFSFRNVCEFLSLDPECLRNGLREWCARAVKERSAAQPALHAYH
jgi:hypothetical protein